MVRRGIDQGADSFMLAMTTIMGKSSKADLVRAIKAFIVPEVFIQLEGGVVLSAFMGSEAMRPKEFRAWLDRHSGFAKCFNLGSDLSHRRAAMIAISYQRFLSYLASDEPKNPQLFYDLFARMGVVLLVWDREADHAFLKCPQFTNMLDVLTRYRKVNMAMLLKNRQFEPLELKQRGIAGRTLVPFAKHLIPLLRQCSQQTNPGLVGLLHGLFTSWIRDMLADPAKFRVKWWIVSPGLKITAVATEGNVWVQLANGGLTSAHLSDLLEIGGSVQFHEDLGGHTLETRNLPQDDVKAFAGKLMSIGCGIDLGVIVSENFLFLNTTVTVPAALGFPLIPIPNTMLKSFAHKMDVEQRQEHSLRRYIASVVLASQQKDRAALASLFDGHPAKAKIGFLLDTLLAARPLDRSDVVQWMMSDQLPWYSEQPVAARGEWIFSQSAVEVGLPPDVVSPPLGPRPNGTVVGLDDVTVDAEPGVAVTTDYPNIISPDTATESVVPTKWRNTGIGGDVLITPKSYTSATLPEFFQWVAAHVGHALEWKEVVHLRNRQVYDIIVAGMEGLSKLMVDVGMREVWNRALKRSYKTAEDVMTNLGKRERSEVLRMWHDICTRSELATIDIDLALAASLLQISVFLVHPSPWGAKEARGDENDRRISSTFFKWNGRTWSERPLLVMNKRNGDGMSVYSIIAEQGWRERPGAILREPSEVNEGLHRLLALH